MSLNNKLNIEFYSPEELYKIAMTHTFNTLNLKEIGLKFPQKVILSRILYRKFIIKYVPYEVYVDENSYDKNRDKAIMYILENIVSQYQKGNRNVTIFKNVQTMTMFFTWLNDQNTSFPKNLNEAKQTFINYTYSLKNNIKTSQFKEKEAHLRHMSTFRLLTNVFNDKKATISAGINIIKAKTEQPTKVPNISDLKYSINFYYRLFIQIANFILEEQDYPFNLSLMNKEFCVTHSRKWNNKNEQKRISIFYDKDLKKIRDIEEIDNIITLSDKDIKIKRQRFIKSFNINNTNKNSKPRIELAKIALKAYFMHFLAVTGMNDSTAATLLWNNEYSEEKDTYNFKNIKYRAKNKALKFRNSKRVC